MKITKMHGLGNSQIIVEDFDESLEGETNLSYNQIARALCHPNFGVGSDQMLILLPSQKADFRMRIFNKDGGEAEMCGNGIRCVARYLYDSGKAGERLTIETKGGLKTLHVSEEDGDTSIRVDMGKGELLEEEKKVQGFKGSFVSVGNPHFVIFTEEASKEMALEEGPGLEEADEFMPDKANIEFADIVSPEKIKTYVWERGAGLTLACGTGACATAFAARKKGSVEPEVQIHLLGGTLRIKIDDDNRIWMTGPAEYVLEGEVSDVPCIYSNVKNLE